MKEKMLNKRGSFTVRSGSTLVTMRDLYHDYLDNIFKFRYLWTYLHSRYYRQCASEIKGEIETFKDYFEEIIR